MKSPMGIAVRASLGGRASAALVVASTVQDEARQDESHARDADHVCAVRGEHCAVRVVVDRAEVDDEVQDAARGHQRQADDHRERQAPETFYHEHVLEIHPPATACQVYCTKRHVIEFWA